MRLRRARHHRFRGAAQRLRLCLPGMPARNRHRLSYRAVFVDEAVVQIEGERRSWRRTGGPGRWVEQTFCPTCGALVFMTGEGLPGAVSVSVGCFAEPDFAPPATLFRARRKHHWFEPGPATRISD